VQPPRHAVIAAAGLGSRLGHGRPKALVHVGGRAIIDHQLELLRDVPHLRVVVGYCEADVIEHVRERRRDVVFVRNPAFRETTTLQSYWLGSRGLTDPCLFLDADIIFEPTSFARFLGRCADGRSRIAVAEAGSDDAVFVETESTVGGLVVTEFQRERRCRYEWANLAQLRHDELANEPLYVYEHLAGFHPLLAEVIATHEVDTQADLDRAEAAVVADRLAA
jgi:choline kinase